MIPTRVLTLLRKRSERERDGGPITSAGDASAFPFKSLPYELQLMIAKEALLAPSPIVVGTRINTWNSSAEEELATRGTSAVLRTCRDFASGDLYRHYYSNNVFELGYYYEHRNFFAQPGKDLVRYVIVDMLRIMIRAQGAANMIIQRLKLLPALRCVMIRIRGSLHSNSLFSLWQLQSVLISICRSLESLKEIELVVESMEEGKAETIREYEEFLESELRPEDIWPEGLPEGRAPVEARVSLMMQNLCT